MNDLQRNAWGLPRVVSRSLFGSAQYETAREICCRVGGSHPRRDGRHQRQPDGETWKAIIIMQAGRKSDEGLIEIL